MKRILFLALTVLLAAGCYDDAALWDQIRDHEERIVSLEKLCNQMNTNISSLQTIVAALQDKDYVTNVAPIAENGKEIGYTITFSKSGSVTIYHGQDGKDGANGQDGKDGKDGYTPVIGVKQDGDGAYYWTVDGNWLTDAAGNRIPTTGKDGADGSDGANGITPQLKIEESYWYISYDNGRSWEMLGKAVGEDGKDGADGDSFFQSVTKDDKNVYITMSDGTVITIEYKRSLTIEFIMPVIEDSAKVYETPFEVAYKVYGSSGEVEIETICEKEWEVKIIPSDEVSGVISVAAALYDVDNKIAVFVTDSQHSITKVLNINLPYIRFEDKDTEIWCLDHFDRNEDQKLTFAEAASWTDLVGTHTPSSPFGGKNFDEFKYFVSIETVSWFFKGTSLTSIIIPENVRLEERAFEGSALEKIILPESLTILEEAIFRDCKNLKEIVIPNNVWQIKEYAFSGCEALEKVVFPSHMTSIEIGAFNRCLSLKEVNLPLGIQKIEASTFADCGSIEKISLPSSLKSVASNAFGGCESVKYAVVDELSDWFEIDFENQRAHPFYNSYKNKPQLMNKSGKVLSSIYVESVDVNGLKVVKDYSLIGYNGSVTLDNNIRVIGRNAFYGSSIKEITMPSKLDSIATAAFGNCDSLLIMRINDVEKWLKVKLAGSSSHPLARASYESHTSMYGSDGKPIYQIQIPRSVSEIPDYCFYGHKDLRRIELGDYNGSNLNKIGKYAFYRCSSLTHVYIRTANPPTLGDNAFEQCSEKLKIYVPKESLDAYKAAPGWSENADKIVSM